MKIKNFTLLYKSIILYSTIIMGKKNNSLLNFKQKNTPKLSQFNQFADKLYQAKQKNRQKLHQTQQKVLARSGAKGRILKAKKANKFSLLDDIPPQQQFMSHKGKPINQIKAFNDVQFGEYQEQENYKQAQSQLQFAGFQDKVKTKNDVYKEIMEKSKMYKQQRQDQYQKNYTSAVDLDQNLQKLIPNLKFQSKASRFQQKMQGRDLEYERLLQELEQDERVIPQTTQLRKKKQTNRNRAKKAEQLRDLMKEDDQQDIRGWVNNQAQQSDQEGESQGDELDQLQLSEDGNDDEDDEVEEGDEDDLDENDESNDNQQEQQGQIQESNQILVQQSEEDKNQQSSVQEEQESLSPIKQIKQKKITKKRGRGRK